MRCSAEPNCGHPSQQQPELGATARSLYVEWHVIPLLPGTKRPACPGHPAAKCDRSDPWCRHGHTGWEQRATTSDPRIIRAWSSPSRIGIACGPSGLLVVDTDQSKPDTIGQATSTDNLAADDPTREVNVAWQCTSSSARFTTPRQPRGDGSPSR
jgi:hypothetical protein